MRLSMISGAAMLAGATLALAGCGGHGVVPSSAVAPMGQNSAASQVAFGDAISPQVTTCAKSPPQYDWIVKGACTHFTLKSSGGSFTLGQYQNLSVTGSIGANDVKGSATIDLADAIDKNGDIEKFNGKSFPAYKARGTTIIYAAADNQSTQVIKPIVHQGKTILKYVITDSKNFPGNTCAAALLGSKGGKLQWTSFPNSYPVKNKTVTISVFEAPSGFELPPKGMALYIAVNCF